MLIWASYVESGASLMPLSPPLARLASAHFLDHIFTLFPMVRGLLFVEVDVPLVFPVCCMSGTVSLSFPPGGPQALAGCDCLACF